MAVTVTFVEFNGSQPENSQGSGLASNLNFGNTDARNIVASSYPIAAGSNSYAKFVQAQWSGSFTKITNAKLWLSAGALKTGEAIKFSGSYSKITPATTALPAVGGKSVPDIPTSQPSSANVAFAKSTDESTFTTTAGHIPNSGQAASSPGYYSGSRSSTMAFQMQTTGAIDAGPVNTKTISLSYDRQ